MSSKNPPQLSYVQVSSAYLLGLITAGALFFYFQTPLETTSVQDSLEQHSAPESANKTHARITDKIEIKQDNLFTQNKQDQEQARNSNSTSPEQEKDNDPVSTPHELDVLPIQDPNSENSVPARMQAMNNQFQNETHDTDWATKVESETWEKFYSEDLDGSDIQSVDCRTTLCKIVFTHDTKDASKHFTTRLLSQLDGAQGTIRSHVDDKGQLVTTVFRMK